MFSKFQRIMWFWASKWLRICNGCLKKDPIKFDHGLRKRTYSMTGVTFDYLQEKRSVWVTSQ